MKRARAPAASAASSQRLRAACDCIRQILGRRHLGHRDLMVEARLLRLERGGHIEDLLAVLNRNHAAA